MAYLRDLPAPKCKTPYCSKKPTVELVDRWNGSRGEYCRTCGEKALKVQQTNEGGGYG